MATSGSASVAASRTLLVPVVDAEACERALKWTIDNVYRAGDSFSFMHVLPPAQTFSASSVQPSNFQASQAETFIQERFLPQIQALDAPNTISIETADHDCDSVGAWICHKADEADAALVVMAAHQKGRIPLYILGSTTKYCLNRCGYTVLVAH